MAKLIETIQARAYAPLKERLSYYRSQASAATELAKGEQNAELRDAYAQLAEAWLRLAEESERVGRPIF